MKNLLAFAIGCTMVGALLYAIQAMFITKQEHGDKVLTTSDSQFITADSRLGWAHLATASTRQRSTKGDRVIFDAQYDSDEYGRRITPQINDNPTQKFLLFFGGSNTFGHGLNGDETLPYLTALYVKDAAVYNYAVSGYGAGHVLAQIEHTDLRSQIPQQSGYAIYVFPTSHIDRLIGGVQTLTWANSLPYYTLENGAIVRKGFIQEQRPIYTWFAQALGNSFLHQRYQIDWPFSVNKKDLEFACRVIEQSKALLEAQFEELKFILVLYPDSLEIDLTFCLSPHGIEYLDLRQAFQGIDWDSVSIVGDGHVNGFGNEILARKLADYLNTVEW